MRLPEIVFYPEKLFALLLLSVYTFLLLPFVVFFFPIAGIILRMGSSFFLPTEPFRGSSVRSFS